MLVVARRKVVDARSGGNVRDYDEVKPKRARQRDEVKYLKWWLALAQGGGDAARATLWQWVDRQRTTWSGDAIGDLVSEAIYSDTPISAAGRLNANGRWTGGIGGRNPINKIKALVDTGTARLTKVRSMPVISADDADYTEARFAREQSRVLRRKMGSGDMELAAPLVVRDFIIRGTAYGKIERVGGDTEFRRVPAYEVVYDHREALYSLLTQRAHVRPESRDTLIARFPAMKEAILAAPQFNRVDAWMSYTYVGPNLADMVEVAESWHPPSSPTAKDGQWIVCLRNKTIARAPWTCPRDPLVPVYWSPPTRGVGRGTGLVYEQSEAQGWVNDILSDAREAIHYGSQLKVFQPRQGGANKHHLKARHPAVIEHDGAEPRYIAADPVSKQAWSIAFQMLEVMDATSGISSWASQAKASLPGTPSGKALDTMDDQQSDRFAHVESGYQQWRVQVGLRHVDGARMMHDEANGKLEKMFDEQPPAIKKDELAAWIRENEWPDVDVDGGDYHLTLEPENFITGARGGKLNEVNEAAKAGLIPDPSLSAAMFEEPDIARANRGILGPVHRIEQCLSDLSNPKVPLIECMPDPEMNVALGKLLALGELEEAKSKKASDVICQRFRDFIAECKRIDAIAKAGAPSLAGAQQNNIVAQGNAAQLLGPDGGPPPGPGGAPPGAPPQGAGPGGMPAFGDGGVVSKPTVALIGEKGPEVVVPIGQAHGTVANYLQSKYGYSPELANRHADFYLAHSDPNSKSVIAAAHQYEASGGAPVQFPAGFQQGFEQGLHAPMAAAAPYGAPPVAMPGGVDAISSVNAGDPLGPVTRMRQAQFAAAPPPLLPSGGPGMLLADQIRSMDARQPHLLDRLVPPQPAGPYVAPQPPLYAQGRAVVPAPMGTDPGIVDDAELREYEPRRSIQPLSPTVIATK